MARIGVCSWSLQADNPDELARRVTACGVAAVQLALDPVTSGVWNEAETTRALRVAKIDIISGMMGFKGEDYSTLDSIRRTGGVALDEHWAANLAAAKANARLADRLGLTLVTLHAGFIPHEPSDPARGRLLARLRQIVDIFGDKGVRVGLETGQETAPTLLEALDQLDRPHVGVNFDPANMILYGMGDPIEALRLLRRRIVQVHIKDARASRTKGEWGEEVRAGAGDVDWPAFFAALRESPRGAGAGVDSEVGVDLFVEREAGAERVDDARAAVALVGRHVPSAA
ncbi:MAG: sugar phosphate isomerase/epimerase [Phycisphaerae bacterium]|nr:sugar phosphate isomerase/epimerase [Phycisphaerae bacterium]